MSTVPDSPPPASDDNSLYDYGAIDAEDARSHAIELLESLAGAQPEERERVITDYTLWTVGATRRAYREDTRAERRGLCDALERARVEVSVTQDELKTAHASTKKLRSELARVTRQRDEYAALATDLMRIAKGQHQ